MRNNEILNRSRKVLTNKFTGMNVEKVSGAIQNKFQFNVENKTTEVLRLAIIPGYLPRLVGRMATTTKAFVKSVDFAGEKVETEEIEAIDELSMVSYDPRALQKAGYPVDLILGDDTVKMPTGDVIMAPSNPNKTVADFLEYIRTNPLYVKDMTIVSSDKTAFESDMTVVKMNPFTKEPGATIDLNKFFSKYQQVEDRIDIDFKETPLEICDDVLVIMNIPVGAKMSVTLRF